MNPDALTLAVALAVSLPSARVPSATVATIARAAPGGNTSPSLLAAVCWMESRLGTVPSASLCGVRLRHAYVADPGASAAIAARSLARWSSRCRSELRGLAAWRTGRGCGADDGGYGRRVLSLAARIERASLGVVLLTGDPLVLRLEAGGAW